ncbi:hypothetical protein H5154_04930 [Pseudoalteromonas sp. SR44-5]|uniref:hypothetical protein n=1 Tax=unclassified Pseudoalteromonas TaxID=194690 RepID=UPI0015FEDD4F|nr:MULTISPECIES: hypothetical protein [unclassified Pseudoalteromonas]MBB1365732.1 hypothetical protein [Pseudoalteromonas sp. SR44-5]MBB1416807.1 hypothetical protein [Pseudoalteromonas sp. SG44-1]MBB1432876.1 hypothetical protein [Pseudoalteromonas sp. SG43-6]MBB1480040.1 hypothetical protein [Pseudoalteromonas sp. SG41-2]
MNNKRLFGVTLLIFSAALLTFKLSSYLQQAQHNDLIMADIENRIALDLPRLDLSNRFLKHSGNHDAIVGYLQRLNMQLIQQPIQVNTINDVSLALTNNGRESRIEYLETSDQKVAITFLIETRWWHISDIYTFMVLLLLAFLFSKWAELINRTSLKHLALKEQVEQLPLINVQVKLVIDLQAKVLAINDNAEIKAGLANKPLCFYLALIEFCVENPDVILNQNKDVPDELIELANKYFYRLTQLGHTIRKRPNFTNSLEKTLSEIRAALDEVLIEHSQLKEKYYPPKAHGEGSRSRLHSYGLSNIKADDIEVIGK